MTTTASDAACCVLVPAGRWSAGERQALAGFLSGYGGLTREAYSLDLRQYTVWCTGHGLQLLAAKRSTSSPSVATWKPPGRSTRDERPPALHRRRVLSLRRRRRAAGPFPAEHLRRPRLDYNSDATALDRYEPRRAARGRRLGLSPGTTRWSPY
jgi:integrase/recombinase XerD